MCLARVRGLLCAMMPQGQHTVHLWAYCKCAMALGMNLGLFKNMEPTSMNDTGNDQNFSSMLSRYRLIYLIVNYLIRKFK